MIRLMGVLLHGGSQLNGWRTVQTWEAVRSAYVLSPKACTLNQPRYDLRKMKGHGLLERVGRHYAYRLTEKGIRVAALFVLYDKRICGPLANSLFHHSVTPSPKAPAKIEIAYNEADAAIQNLIDQLAAWKESGRRILRFVELEARGYGSPRQHPLA